MAQKIRKTLPIKLTPGERAVVDHVVENSDHRSLIGTIMFLVRRECKRLGANPDQIEKAADAEG